MGNRETSLVGRLALRDRLGFIAWKQLKLDRSITLHLKDGTRLIVRQRPSTDLGIAREIFGARIYDCTRRLGTGSVKTIVDLGANVGYSLLYWARAFPEARVRAFEPHPEHVRIALHHLAINGIGAERVEIVPAAVGVRAGTLQLTDGGAGSRVVEAAEAGSVAVKVVDLFAAVADLERIDLMKVDVEGAEYGLLGDERFGGLAVRAMVLEYHVGAGHGGGLAECRGRLEGLGYRVEELEENDVGGLLWAERGSVKRKE